MILDKDRVSELMQESQGANKEDIKEMFRDYIEKCGAPTGSFYDKEILSEMAKEMNITYNDKNTLVEVIDELREEDNMISEVINNNLNYFGDLD